MDTVELKRKKRVAQEAYSFLDWLLFEDGDLPYHGNIVLHVNASEIYIVEPDRKYRQKEWRRPDQDN